MEAPVLLVFGAVATLVVSLLFPYRRYGGVDWRLVEPLVLVLALLALLVVHAALVLRWNRVPTRNGALRVEDVTWLWSGIIWAAFVRWAFILIRLD